ncbi:LacI family DNA-binding transcriptional regulator [Prosthecomicrobium sp. N25]|uniref:LacI family DNA-binding transcriptional regulator n=1 Tax=Prosthecomicrobium sp. N25 TaxID=3129254 RepID=UPI003076DD3C
MSRSVPTIRDVAERAGVSPGTVSNVLGNRKPVDPVLAERVRRAAAELGYRVHRAASQLRSGRTKVVAVLVPGLENPFFTALVAALERCTRAEGYEIIVGSAGEDEDVEANRLSALLSWRPAGVVIVPCRDRFATRSLLVEERVPFVVVDRVADDIEADCVAIDNAAAAGAAAEHLIGLGHREILVAASTSQVANIRARCAGIREAVAGVPGGTVEILELGPTFETAAERMEARMRAGPLPSAAIALTNFTTLALLGSLTRFGVRVPDDLSLVGFDDYAWMQATTPSITAVRQPIDRMAAEAWRCLSARMAGSDAPWRRAEFAAELEIRQSTRPAVPAPGTSRREGKSEVRRVQQGRTT